MKYRPDIDALRCIAVVAVVLFHAFPSLRLIQGGFVGVDVFFVISGYLITSILVQELYSDRFSIAGFYKRRVIRILPSLLVLLGGCLIAGRMWLIAADNALLGKHVAASSVFLSNFLLWSEVSYFDEEAEAKPLLHLWSLAIEEQFYLFFPLLLHLLFTVSASSPLRTRFRFIFSTVSVLAVVSFIIGLRSVEVGSSEAYYSPLSRAWQLLVGALIALWNHPLHQQEQIEEKDKTNNSSSSFSPPSLISLLGLASIFTSMYVLDKDQPYPGWRALFPTLGTAMIIHAGHSEEAWLNRTVLTHPFLLFVGKISYPLYLFHWPLLSFAVILYGRGGTGIVVRNLGLMLVALVSATMVHFYVEKWVAAQQRQQQQQQQKEGLIISINGGSSPAKRKSRFFFSSSSPSSTLPWSLLFALLGLGLGGLCTWVFTPGGWMNGGFVTDAKIEAFKAAREGRCFLLGLEQRLWVQKECIQVSNDRKNVLIWGDSHAADLYYALSTAYPDINFLQVNRGQCSPHLMLQDDGGGGGGGERPTNIPLVDCYPGKCTPQDLLVCSEFRKHVLSFLEEMGTSMDRIVVDSRWHLYVDPNKANASGNILHNTLVTLTRMGLGNKTVVIGPHHMYKNSPLRLLELQKTSSKTLEEVFQDNFLEEIPPLEDLLERVVEKFPEVTFKSGYSSFCSEDLLCTIETEKGEPAMRDWNHWTVAGMRLYGTMMKANNILSLVGGWMREVEGEGSKRRVLEFSKIEGTPALGSWR